MNSTIGMVVSVQYVVKSVMSNTIGMVVNVHVVEQISTLGV